MPRPTALFWTTALALAVDCALPRSPAAQERPVAGQMREFVVGGARREAIVHPSRSGKPGPVVFVFHGFTGRARHSEIAYGLHRHWPEATVVYPQGLNVDLMGMAAPGWQIAPKANEGRDLAFFDAMVARLVQDGLADPKQVYTCGMSNGAIFSYVLASERGRTLAGGAAVGGFAPLSFQHAPAIPWLIIHGKQDKLIGIRQAERSRQMALANNGCDSTSTLWKPGYVRYNPKGKGAPVVWHEHEGGHTWPSDASESIVAFFRGR